MTGIVLLILALLVGAGVFVAAYRLMKQLGGAPESDIGIHAESPRLRGDEDV